MREENKIYLDKEFEKFSGMIEKNENFAFMRNADGERAIMLGRAAAAQEGNWKSPDYVTSLGKAIYESLKLKDKRAFYAISCPCCDRPAYYWYMSRVANPQNVTFANLWINNNYERFKEWFPKIKRDAILIANFRAEGHKIGNLNILKHYKISDDCISFWDKKAPQMLEQIKAEYGSKNDLLYVVSAGPMSGPMIAELFKNNPNNCYIDFGSSIDIYYRGGITRPYMIKGNVYAERNCWMYDPKKVLFDVTVVCCLYKKPETLIGQLEALEKQTLKPKEIFLFQDGIDDSYKIQMFESLKCRFDNIKIAEKNMGVWERFRFAKEAKTPYICIFDDDTIPGESWLENCHFHIMKQNGIYGTNGVILKNAMSYPFGHSLNVGWHGAVTRSTEVDFVGHAWFMERKCLDYMFDGTEQFQKFKYTAEDMCLSIKAKEHGIRTFVPPHPDNNKSLWGSDPVFGMVFGTEAGAVSLNRKHLENMQKAIKLFVAEGWKPLCLEEPRKVKAAIRHVKYCKWIAFYHRCRRFLKRRFFAR